jgi:hypothetical protein
LPYADITSSFKSIRLFGNGWDKELPGRIGGEINVVSSQQKYFILSQISYSCMNNDRIIEEFDLVSKKQLLVFELSGHLSARRILNRLGTGGNPVQGIPIILKQSAARLPIISKHQILQNSLLNIISKNLRIQTQWNHQLMLVNVLKAFEKGPRYKYKSYKSFKIRIRRFFNRTRKNAVISFSMQDWIGPVITKKSRELKVARQKRSVLYENLRYSYGPLKIGSIWEWVSSYRSRVNRSFKVETFLKYYELNSEPLSYRSGFVPTRNLARLCIKMKNICVNGKIIDVGRYRISNLDITTSTSSARVWAKVTYIKYLQSVLYAKKSGLLTFASRFLETDYSISGFIYISQLSKVKDIPITDFKTREYDRNRLVHWGKYDIGKRLRSKVIW